MEPVNTAHGLAVCNHNPQLYQRVLRSFLRQHLPLLNKDQLSPEQTGQLAHVFKSSAATIGALRLHKLALRLAPPAPPPTATECLHLLEETQAVLNCIEQQVEPHQGDPAYTLLRDQLEQHNISAVQLLNNWSADHASQWPTAHRAAIGDALKVFDFDLALRLLEQGKDMFGTDSGIPPNNT